MDTEVISITPIQHIPRVLNNLSMLGRVTQLPYVTVDELIQLLETGRFSILFTNPNMQSFKLDDRILQKTAVRHIITASTGLNHIDLDYCERNYISVTSITKDRELLDKITSTAELAFGLMLSLVRNIPEAIRDVYDNRRWVWQPFIGRQLNKMTVGIVGYGRLGTMMMRYCKAFGMEIKIYDPYVPRYGGKYDTYFVNDIQELFDTCDIVSLHVHVTDETRKFINKEIFNSAKKSVYLINTSRGEIVNEYDVLEALKNKTLSGYAADVLDTEFTDDPTDNCLVNYMTDFDNVIITPHLGGSTIDAQDIAYNAVIDKFKKTILHG